MAYTRKQDFVQKQTQWEGLWYHPELHKFTSAAFNLAALREFKGAVRLVVCKNRYYNNGENGRPNYSFTIRDCKADNARDLEVTDIETGRYAYFDDEDEVYRDEDGARLYTGEEVRKIINGTHADARYGICDPYDILPEDFV